ncbi:MAG: hypothetical protein ABIH03_02840 [Pseudomonadota bacterium]
MLVGTVTENGEIAIPGEIRACYELTPGAQLEFVDERGTIRLLVRRRIVASDPAAGYGPVKVKPVRSRRAESDSAAKLRRSRSKT